MNLFSLFRPPPLSVTFNDSLAGPNPPPFDVTLKNTFLIVKMNKESNVIQINISNFEQKFAQIFSNVT